MASGHGELVPAFYLLRARSMLAAQNEFSLIAALP